MACIREYIHRNNTEMFRFLEKLVTIQSGSRHKAGVDRVGTVIQAFFGTRSFSFETIAQQKLGNHLIVRTKAVAAAQKQILLVGHMDTVFPQDTDFNWYRENGDKSFGPGVIDMKGGLVAGIYALKALEACNDINNLPVTFLFNSDEEIGSPSSQDLIIHEAKRSAFAFVLECGGVNGEVVTARKGNLTIQLTVSGRAGHAAFAGPDKGSAIKEMAYKIIDLENLNDPERGISANVGKTEGGIGANTVPDDASAWVDFRFTRMPDCRTLKEQLTEIVQKTTVPGTRAAFRTITQRPPMPSNPSNRRLFLTVRKAAESLGTRIGEEYRPGVSDANLIAQKNIPVIDGLGPMGARDHSKEEYMYKKSLPERAGLIACAIKACWQAHCSGEPATSVEDL